MRTLVFIVALVFGYSSGQAQKLALVDFNRQYLQEFSRRKSSSDRNINAFRIRVGAEINWVGGKVPSVDLLKLLEYGTYSAFVGKNTKELDVLRELWGRFLRLKQLPTSEFKLEFLFDIPNYDWKDLPQQMAFLKFIQEKIPHQGHERFFYPVIRKRCGILKYLRKTVELSQCWTELRKYTRGDANLVADLEGDRLWYSVLYSNVEKFEEVSQEILKNEKLVQFKIWVKYFKINVLAATGRTAGLSEQVKKVQLEEKNSKGLNEFLIRYYLTINDIENAARYIGLTPQADLQGNVSEFFVSSAAELSFKSGDLKKSLYYIIQAIELTKDQPLDQMRFSLIKMMLELIENGGRNVGSDRRKFESYKQIISINDVTDPEFRSTADLGMALSAEKIDKNEFQKSAAEFRKFQYPNNFSQQVLDKVQEMLLRPKLSPK